MTTFTCPESGITYNAETHFNWKTHTPQCPDCFQDHKLNHEIGGENYDDFQSIQTKYGRAT